MKPRDLRPARRGSALDLLLLVLIGGLALPMITRAVHEMRRPRVSLSRQGLRAPPPEHDGMLLLWPAPQPLPQDPAQIEAAALAEARRRGLALAPETGRPLQPPLLVPHPEGGAFLLIDRKSSLCRVYLPRWGEAVLDCSAWPPGLLAGAKPLRPQRRSPSSPEASDAR